MGIPSAPEAITIATENLSGARAKKVRFACYDGESRVPEYNQFDTFVFYRYKGPRGLSLTRIPRSTKRIASGPCHRRFPVFILACILVLVDVVADVLIVVVVGVIAGKQNIVV